jgi:hypothetical protein
MDPKIRTSFIPKKPISQTRRPTQSGVGLFFLLTLVLFLGTSLVTGGAYLFREFVERSIDSKKDQLEAARAEFEPATIQKLSELDSRIKSAGEILAVHSAPSFFFDTLGDLTLKSVQFTDVLYSEGLNGGISVDMRGTASSFSSVALQSDLFSESNFFIDPIFANLNLDSDSDVIFNFGASINVSSLLFEDVFDSPGYAPSIGTPTSTSTATTTDGAEQNGGSNNGSLP